MCRKKLNILPGILEAMLEFFLHCAGIVEAMLEFFLHSAFTCAGIFSTHPSIAFMCRNVSYTSHHGTQHVQEYFLHIEQNFATFTIFELKFRCILSHITKLEYLIAILVMFSPTILLFFWHVPEACFLHF